MLKLQGDRVRGNQPFWLGIVEILAVLTCLYVLSFGPAAWFLLRCESSWGWFQAVYRPIVGLANRSPVVAAPLLYYARLGAQPRTTPEFDDDQFYWARHGSIAPFEIEISCYFGEGEEPHDEAAEIAESGYLEDAEGTTTKPR